MIKILKTVLLLTLILTAVAEWSEPVHSSGPSFSGLGYLQSRWVSTQPLIDLLHWRLGYPAPAVVQPGRCAQIWVVWDTVERAEIYELYRNGELIFRGEETAYLDDGLDFGQWYSYHIRVVNPSGVESSQNRQLRALTRCAPEYAPRQVAVQPMECGGYVSFSWDEVSEADFYRVERAGRRGVGIFFRPPPWLRQESELSGVGDGQLVYEGLRSEMFEGDLEPGQEYRYAIWAGNETGYSPEAREITVTASKQCPPDRPAPPRSG